MTTPQAGDFVRYRRVQVRPERAGTGEPAFDWVDDYGIVLSARPRKPGQDYLIRVYFPARPDSHLRTLRASKIAEVL